MHPAPGMPLPHPCLVADIGGTNARFASIAKPGGSLSAMVTLATSTHADVAETVQQAIAEGGFPAPRSLLVAVAGPVQEHSATLTNARTAAGPLTVGGPALAKALSLEQGLLLNDFEALCLSLPVLASHSLMPLGPGDMKAGGPMLVVGPGTGLGVAALLVENAPFLPVASEAGHASVGPLTPEDFALWPFFEETPVTFEGVLSGRGRTRLYQACARQRGQRQEVQTAGYVTINALEKSDAAAMQAVDHFMAILGRFAGDMTLAFCATGGVFIGGGIVPRLRDVIHQSGFSREFLRREFLRNGRAAGFLQSVGTQLIVAPDAALQGLAAVARSPAQYRLSYGTRFWCPH
jgi:glucokinase